MVTSTKTPKEDLILREQCQALIYKLGYDSPRSNELPEGEVSKIDFKNYVKNRSNNYVGYSKLYKRAN